MPAPIRQALHDLNSGPFMRFLEQLTGIDHLLPDPHLAGGGIHLSRHGGHLGIHADFNWHEKLQAHRRLNLLIYLTPDWRREYGGELELWNCRRARRASAGRAAVQSRRAVRHALGHVPRPSESVGGAGRHLPAIHSFILLYNCSVPTDEMRPAHSTLYKGYNV